MKECGVCGILYLAGGSCPACGSQIQKRSDDFQDADMILPSEVPGLEDATNAWYELEGVERPQEEVQVEKSSSLPFGFSGESLTNVSRLPFGIGSHRDGIPFDVALSDEQPEDSLKQQTAMESSQEENFISFSFISEKYFVSDINILSAISLNTGAATSLPYRVTFGSHVT